VNERLYRSREDRVIGGVCGGVADRLDLDPSIVRIGWVLLTIFTGGAFLLLYIVMLIVVPEEPLGGYPPAPPPPGEGAVPGWNAPGSGTGGESAMAAPGGVAAGVAGAAEPGAEPSTSGWQAPPGTSPTAAAPAAAWVPPDQAYAARRAERAQRSRQREGTVALVFGGLLILLGVWFLVREYLPDVDLDVFWPVAIIVLGALFVIRAVRFDRGGDSS